MKKTTLIAFANRILRNSKQAEVVKYPSETLNRLQNAFERWNELDTMLSPFPKDYREQIRREESNIKTALKDLANYLDGKDLSKYEITRSGYYPISEKASLRVKENKVLAQE